MSVTLWTVTVKFAIYGHIEYAYCVQAPDPATALARVWARVKTQFSDGLESVLGVGIAPVVCEVLLEPGQ